MSIFGRASVAVVALVPQSAWACSVCYAANEENRLAFLLTTIFLSLLPLAFIGSVVYWIWRQAAPRAKV